MAVAREHIANLFIVIQKLKQNLRNQVLRVSMDLWSGWLLCLVVAVGGVCGNSVGGLWVWAMGAV